MRGRLVLIALAVGVAAALFAAAAASRTSTSSALRLVRVMSGLSDPVYVTAAPGEPGVLYVVEQTGNVLRVKNGRRRVFLDLRRTVDPGGERGLLGLAFHPSYARNRLFYVAYTTPGRNVVALYRSNGTTAIPSSQKILFSIEDPYGNHNGGHVAFGPDGMLYTSIGDGGSGGDPEDRAQDMRSQFGKLLRLDVSKATAQWGIAALGLRNPWRFSFDRANGDLWIGDVGQGEVEEIDWLRRGTRDLVNFGWDVYEGSSGFESKQLGPGRLVQPVAEYSHDQGCTVIGGYVYRGKKVKSARGRYFYGDYCSELIWSLRLVGGKAREQRRESIRVPSLTSFGEDSAGELYFVSHEGAIYRLAGS